MNIIPVGIPGLGKSTLLRALNYINQDSIYVSSDKYANKKKFLDVIIAARAFHPNKNIIIDRNNHTSESRLELLNILGEENTVYVKFIPESYTMTTIQRVARERIKSRGKHHESIKDPVKGQKIVRWLAINYENPNFNNSVEMLPDNTINENLKILIKYLQMDATDEQIDEAVLYSLDYEVGL